MTRPDIGWGLVFCFLLSACRSEKQENPAVTIIWENDKAVALAIPIDLVEYKSDIVVQALEVRLQKTNTAILGEYTTNDTALVFHPLVPLTRGLHYEIWSGTKLAGEVIIPSLDAGHAPKLVHIYPSRDTVPVNILKIHLHFSKPMQEGQALQKILLIKNGRDTVNSAFLDLQQELWNKERTILTIWFDPGRIKRDLQPNLTMGPPLEGNTTYELIITNGWHDTHGASLSSEHKWRFVTGARDDSRPDISQWKISSPVAGSHKVLDVDTGEPLDYILLTSAIQVFDEAGNVVAGEITPLKDLKGFVFIPTQPWKKGEYTLHVEARLEDLAGNNLNRLFDTDLTAKEPPALSTDVYKRRFHAK